MKEPDRHIDIYNGFEDRITFNDIMSFQIKYFKQKKRILSILVSPEKIISLIDSFDKGRIRVIKDEKREKMFITNVMLETGIEVSLIPTTSFADDEVGITYAYDSNIDKI